VGGAHNGQVTDLMLPLFQLEDEKPTPVPLHPFLGRVVADSTDRVAWIKARSRGITATDVAKLSTPGSVRAAAQQKLHGTGFTGNAFTEHGKAREPQIAAWVKDSYGIDPSTTLFHAAGDARHLATPDGIGARDNGSVELAEIKTTNKGWRSIPRNYLRQVWWQQYVLGAERTLFVWERHENFVPVGTPECRWIERDENEIAILVGLANQLLRLLRTGRL
jgi:hypothetical protein